MASRPSFQDTVNNIPFERLEVLGMTLESFPDCHNNFMGHFPITNTYIVAVSSRVSVSLLILAFAFLLNVRDNRKHLET